MQVASLCDTVEPALVGNDHISPDDALELHLFEMAKHSASSSNSG